MKSGCLNKKLDEVLTGGICWSLWAEYSRSILHAQYVPRPVWTEHTERTAGSQDGEFRSQCVRPYWQQKSSRFQSQQRERWETFEQGSDLVSKEYSDICVGNRLLGNEHATTSKKQ